jgi:hypothetical protein
MLPKAHVRNLSMSLPEVLSRLGLPALGTRCGPGSWLLCCERLSFPVV